MSSLSPFKLLSALLFRSESGREVASFDIVGPLQGHLEKQIYLGRVNV